EHYDDEWTDREYIPLFVAKNKNQHHKGRENWWLPGDNSTSNEVKPKDYKSFEEWILKPVFDISIQDLLDKRMQEMDTFKIPIDEIRELQQKFKAYLHNEQLVFDNLNALPKIEKLKIYYEYGTKNVETNPVVWLRKSIIEHLVESDQP